MLLRLLCLLFVGCGAPLVTISSEGESSGWSFAREALTSAKEGDVSFPMSGCRGVYSANVKAGPGVVVSEAGASEWIHPQVDGHTWVDLVSLARTSETDTNRVVLVKRGDQLVGKLRPVFGRREGARFVVGIDVEPIDGP